MKKTLSIFAFTTFVVFGLIVTASSGSAFGQGEVKGGGGRLAGTWDAVVTIEDCATGNPISIFNSIGTFSQGGTSIGSTAGIPQSRRTPEHGVWRHESGNTYSFKFKSFSFDAVGAPTGWVIVAHQLELGSDANSYTSAGGVQVFAPNGNQVGQGCSSAVGTRFNF
jgi:hypothetical protein